MVQVESNSNLPAALVGRIIPWLRTLNWPPSTISQEEFQKRAQEINQKASAYQRDAQEREAKLEAAFRNAAVKVENAISQIVDEIAKERHILMTFRRVALMGNTTAPDITPEVLKRLNQRMPSVVVELPK